MICRICNKDKENTEFGIIKSTYQSTKGPILYKNYRLDCKECHAKKKFQKILENTYKISFEEYCKILSLQDYKCAICKNTFTGYKEPYIDHCHKTEKVRGLLCAKCNFGLGHFKDNENLLLKAIEYLKA